MLFFCVPVSSQDLSSVPQNGIAFPPGTKFVIQLIPTDSIHFDYSLISYESYRKVVDIEEFDAVFKKNKKSKRKKKEAGNHQNRNDLIEFYFCLGTKGNTKKEKKENIKMVLLIKNHTEHKLSYTSEIQIIENGNLMEISNSGLSPSGEAIEMWPYMVHYLGLHSFKIDEK